MKISAAARALAAIAVAATGLAGGGAENGQPGPPPSIDPSTGETRAQWPVTDALAIGGDWVSGYYVAKALLTDGPEVGNAATVPFVVEASAPRPSAILVVAAENTW